MNTKILKITTGILTCFALLTVGTCCYNNQVIKAKNNEQIVSEEPIIFTEVSHYDTLYNFADSKVLEEHSDLVVIGKITNLEEATNFNPKTQKYGKARTPGKLEVIEIIKSNKKEATTTIDFMDVGGLISYEDYEKSLLPAQKSKRDYLMEKNGQSLLSKSNMFVKQEVANQLKLEEDKTYIMYLIYNEDFGKYMVVNQPYGIKEYNPINKQILNHVTNSVENLEDLK